MSLFQHIQSWAPVPVYAVIGEDGVADVERLRLKPAVRFVASVRHAAILLVCGTIRANDAPALRRLHDQLPHPRASFWWRSTPLDCAVAPMCEQGDEPIAALVGLDAALRSGARDSEADWLPDEPPNSWKGKGDHGQGGKGMMGGTPYGRPMAMTDEDLRDGLALDALTVSIGPFAAMLPPGLALEVTLQGDVIQSAKILRAAYRDDIGSAAASRWQAARLLEMLGLDALAAKCRQIHRSADARRGHLSAAAARSGAFLAIPPGLGAIGQSDVRSRMRAALSGEQTLSVDNAALLIDLLRGLEWQEAMLVANSFTAQQLAMIAPVTPERAHGRDDSEASATAHHVHHQHSGHG